MPVSLWLLAFIILFLFLHKYYKNRHLYAAAKKFPGPRDYPILGNSLDFTKGSNGIFQTFVGFSNQYGRFYRLWNNGNLFVITKDYRDAEALLGSNFHIVKSDLYRFAKPWIGEGLLTSKGEKWRHHRRVITPTFHFKILEQFLEIFNKNAQSTVESLKPHAGKEPFNIYDYGKTCALSNICESAMGVDFKTLASGSDYVRAVRNILFVIGMRFFKVWLMVDFFFNLSKYAKLQKESLKVLHETTNALIKERRQKFANLKNVADPQEEDDIDEVYGKKKMAFLDLLIQSSEGAILSDKDLREEVDTTLFAGHDTVSSALGFTLYELANNQDVQEKAYMEQAKMFGDSDRMPTYGEIQQMKYLEMVIKEALRLYPPVATYGRELEEDIKLVDDVIVPKGAQLILNVYSIHRDPQIWPNPDKFNPENFTKDAICGRNPYCFIPFSAGPRNCVGQKFAMTEMKAAISNIIRNYKLLPSPYEKDKIQLTTEVMLISSNGIHLQIESRH